MVVGDVAGVAEHEVRRHVAGGAVELTRPSDDAEHRRPVPEMPVCRPLQVPVVAGPEEEAVPVAEVDRRDRRERAVAVESHPRVEERLVGVIVEDVT